MKIYDPSDDCTITEVEVDTKSSLHEKFTLAGKAGTDWWRTPLSERIQTINRFAELLDTKSDYLAETLTRETGKPIRQSRGEIKSTGGRISFFTENVKRVLDDQVVYSDGKGMVEKISREPLGVIANISAWNYPYFVGTNVFVPALLTGNSVLYKPSEYATMTGLEIAGLLYEAGVPKDVFAPVIGGGEVGACLLEQSVAAVFFTGSHPTGVNINRAAASRLLKVQLELGGKDPTYVCDDVDVESAAESLADGAFYNSGQSCCSVERLYVHKDIFDDFVSHFVKTVKSFVIGPPMDENTYIGPLTRKDQLKVLSKQVQQAVEKGAEILCGGNKMQGQGNYFEPTVLTEVNHEMLLMRKESFGPIIGIEKVNDDDEAVRLMNWSDFGLTAGVYSKDQFRAEGLLSQLKAGTVYWNCCDRVSARLPWTGRKGSGMGSTLSTIGIDTFTQPKAWHLCKPSL